MKLIVFEGVENSHSNPYQPCMVFWKDVHSTMLCSEWGVPETNAKNIVNELAVKE